MKMRIHRRLNYAVRQLLRRPVVVCWSAQKRTVSTALLSLLLLSQPVYKIIPNEYNK